MEVLVGWSIQLLYLIEWFNLWWNGIPLHTKKSLKQIPTQNILLTQFNANMWVFFPKFRDMCAKQN